MNLMELLTLLTFILSLLSLLVDVIRLTLEVIEKTLQRKTDKIKKDWPPTVSKLVRSILLTTE